MPVVQMPDGQLVDMPDNPSPEELAALKRISERAAAPAEMGVIESAGRKLLGGFGKGAVFTGRGAQLLADTFLPSDQQGQGRTGIDNGMQGNPTSRGIGSALDTAEKFWTQFSDKSPYNGIGGAALEGVGGALASGAKPSLTTGAAGAGSGAGAYAAERLTGDSGISKVLGAILGGGVGGAVASRLSNARPQTATLAREMLEGIPPEMLQKAQAYQAAAWKNGMPGGVKLDLAQALEAVGAPAGNITTVRNFLANHKQGNQVQDTLRNQPGQLSVAADDFAGGLPGTNVGMPQAANRLQEAATTAIQQAKDQRSQLWEQTLLDTRNTLRQVADSKLGAANAGVKQAADRLAKLEQDLSRVKAADAGAIEAANAKIVEAKKLIENLRSFSLPRGQATTNGGSFMDLPQRGQSIDFDSIGRDVRANSLESALPPPVAPAPSMEQIMAQRAAEQGRSQLTAAQTAQQQALGARKSIEAVPAPVVDQAAMRLRALAEKYPNTAQARYLTDIADRLYADGNPLSDPKAINQVLKEATTRLKDVNLATQGVDAGTSKFIASQIQQTRDQLGAAFEPMKAANKAYSTFTADVIDPLKQGPVGQFATPRGYAPDRQASIAKFETLLERGSDATAKTSDIRTLGTSLAKVDPEAVPNAVKSYVSAKIKAAYTPGADAATAANNPDMAKKIAQNLFSNELQYQGLKDAISVSAKSLGQKPEEMVRGLDNLVRLTRAVSNRPQSVGGMQPREVLEMGGKAYGADALRVFGFLPFERAARGLENAVLGKTLSQLDQILTTPEGAAMLVKLGKTPVMSNKAMTVLGTFGGAAGSIDNPP